MFFKVIKNTSYNYFKTNCSRKMSTLHHIVTKLNDFAPLSLAESWDNVGLLVEPHNPRSIKTILLTNDLTEIVMKEAIDRNADLIISYHPPIFAPLKRITQSNWKERIISQLLENRIALYSPHTAWDSINGGVNDWLSKSFSFSSIQPIVPNNLLTDDNNTGAGRILQLTDNTSLRLAIDLIKKHTGLKNVHVSMGINSTMNTTLKTVALCAGSGSSVLKSIDADLYLTGEMSHHEILDAIHRNVNVVLCNHSNSERGYLVEFKEKFNRYFDDNSINIILSKTDVDPLMTY